MQTISQRASAFAFLLMAAVTIAYAQGGRYDTARELVDRVQHNLRRAEHFTPPNEKEKERYHNAQHHLSEFDQKLREGKFDKDKLDGAIDDMKNVVEHNTLSAEDRDTLSRDLHELRELRERRGESD
jgi:hypothetical protein